MPDAAVDNFGLRPLPGNNNPPEAEAIFDQLQARTNALIENANLWANERPEITSEDEAEKAGDFLDQLRKLGIDKTGAIDKARFAEQQPHTDKVAAVREKYKPIKRSVEIAIKLMRDKLTPWLEKKRLAQEAEQRAAERAAAKARETAERAAAEAEHGEGDVIGNTMRAEEAQKQATEADKAARRAQAGPKVASAFGGRAKTLRLRMVVEIDDATKIPAKYLRRLCAQPYVTEALKRAVRDIGVADFEAVPGITIREERAVA